MAGTLTLTDQHKEVLGIRNAELKKYSGSADAEAVNEYIMNKLIEETGHEDPSIRIKAYKMLGEMDCVGAFSAKNNVVIGDQSDDALEKLLKKKLTKILGKPIKGEVVK